MKHDLDLTYCGIDLWVQIYIDKEDLSFDIEKVGYYNGKVCQKFDWESAFDYDKFYIAIKEAI